MNWFSLSVSLSLWRSGSLHVLHPTTTLDRHIRRNVTATCDSFAVCSCVYVCVCVRVVLFTFVHWVWLVRCSSPSSLHRVLVILKVTLYNPNRSNFHCVSNVQCKRQSHICSSKTCANFWSFISFFWWILNFYILSLKTLTNILHSYYFIACCEFVCRLCLLSKIIRFNAIISIVIGIK